MSSSNDPPFTFSHVGQPHEHDFNNTTIKMACSRKPLQSLQLLNRPFESSVIGETIKAVPLQNKSNNSSCRGVFSSKEALTTSSPPTTTDYTAHSEPENRSEDCEPFPNSIFRSQRRHWSGQTFDLEEMWTLKRANPVCDTDEDEAQQDYASPSKRTRTTALCWAQRVGDDDDFSIQSLSSL